MMQDYQQELNVIRDLLKKNPNGMSVTDISKALKKNKNTIGRYLDILLISGQVDMRTYGMAKVYSLSQRVPLSAMLSYSKELIMVFDTESRIIDVNANFLTLLHLSREETIGKNLTYLQSPEVDVHDLISIQATDREERESTVTFNVRGKGERIFNQKCVPTVFDDGRKGITLILEDVTEHILAEREIRENEERFRMMAENIHDGLIILENGKTVYANNRISEITGYSLEELWAMNTVSIVPTECQDAVLKRIHDIETNPDKPASLQMWIIRKDGERRFVYLRFSAVRHSDIRYNFIIFTDITELKTQEAKVRESEQRFRMMAENIQDGLIIVENEQVVYSNHRINEITGYSDEEMISIGLHGTIIVEEVSSGMAAAGLIPHSDKTKLEEIVKSVKPDSGTPGEFKIWITRKDGTPRFIQGKVTAARHGDVTSTYITIADITVFAEREKTLRERIDALQQILD
ncbi:PAS domain S-box protein [Methanoregula sp.]|uniref:PAS domain S-box protein n=1 Tax=Methanoregula sp. TaxID=2052170 RepID=UPI002369A77F|nr:PAS domain S-box protein [Methanoregula sp.]MDD1686768.1 PAS domain S-box protein [Methanoregula sp.]